MQLPVDARGDTASAALYRRAVEVMPGGNTRHTVFYPPHPIYAARGEGAYVWDVDERRYLDLISNYSAAIHGHAFPPVVKALCGQAALLGAVGLPTAYEIELAELLQARLPGLERLRFVNSGTEALMYAIRAARAFTGRPRIAKVEGAYHGGYDLAEASLSPSAPAWGEALAPEAVPVARGTPSSVADEVLVLPMRSAEAATARIREAGSTLAAVIVDPVMSRVGFLSFPGGYLEAVQEAAREVGALFVLDEVYAFRIGYNGAQGRLGLRPDLTTLGKIIGGGVPVGAFGGRADVMAVFDPRAETRAHHGGTFNGNPLAMAAGLAAMRALTPEAFDALEGLGERLRAGLRSVLEELGVPGQVQGVASLAALTPHRAPYRDYREMVARDDGQAFSASDLHAALLARGVLITRSGLFVLNTAVTAADVDCTMEAVRDALRAICRDLGDQRLGANSAITS